MLKRFVNIYRLFKVRADDVLEFVDADRADADYLVVLYLLVEITGHPEGVEWLAQIRSADDMAELDVPDGWPTNAAPFKRWVNDVARFSFRAIGVSPRVPAEPMLTLPSGH